MALVLVSDVSRSVDDSEFRLQKQGYTTAFTDPAFLLALRSGAVGAIAVSYVEFAGSVEVALVLDWTVLHDADEVAAFAARLEAAPRSFAGRTAIGSGIDRAMLEFIPQQLGAIEPTRRVIDVCGDGTSNAGRPVTAARDDALSAGVTINGLTIINDHPVSYTYAHVQPPGGLTQYYRENVIGGSGAFVIEIHDFATFGAAMTRKLIEEVAGRQLPSQAVALRQLTER